MPRRRPFRVLCLLCGLQSQRFECPYETFADEDVAYRLRCSAPCEIQVVSWELEEGFGILECCQTC